MPDCSFLNGFSSLQENLKPTGKVRVMPTLGLAHKIFSTRNKSQGKKAVEKNDDLFFFLNLR
jgi:hypothetical protein